MSTGEFVELNKENEHILVCLSSSPSNEKIIRTAAKMARDMRARFTALYVQTGKRERESDKRRLEAHVQFAKESGAEIVMTHGENVPVQIAEYAHLSNVTKIVIGQSSAKRNHFFSKQTLTEKLNIVPATVLGYEQGRFPIPYEIAVLLAEELQISESLLFDDFCVFLGALYTEVLHTVRKHHGLNQVDFAENAGISPSIYAKWESDSRRPSRKMYQQLKAIYPEI